MLMETYDYICDMVYYQLPIIYINFINCFYQYNQLINSIKFVQKCSGPPCRLISVKLSNPSNLGDTFVFPQLRRRRRDAPGKLTPP